MKINELEKIVNDGLVKYKAFKDAGDALSQVRSLAQATEDLGKTVSGLEKDRDVLLSEVSKLSDKIKLADKKAAEIEDAANTKALAIVSKAELEAKAKQSDADRKLAETNALIASMQSEALKAKQLQDENAATKKALDEEKARLEKVKADLLSIMNVKG